MIFLRYESFRSYIRLYPVTAFLIGLNILVFVCDWLLLDKQLTVWGVFFQYPLDPYGLQEPWRYLTSIVLHGGWDHLLFNSFSLYVFAPPLERLLGRSKYTILYVLAGLGGNVLSALIYAGKVHASLGASGAIYGIFGAFLFLAAFRQHTLDANSRKTIFIILIIGVAYSLVMPGINIWAHIGGALTGLGMMALWVTRIEKRRGHR